MKISGHVAHIVWVICNVYTVQVLWNVEVIFEHLFVIQNFEVTDYVLNELVAYLFDLILSKFFESKLKVSSRTFWTCRFENKCWRGRRTTPSVSWPDVCWISVSWFCLDSFSCLDINRFSNVCQAGQGWSEGVLISDFLVTGIQNPTCYMYESYSMIDL